MDLLGVDCPPGMARCVGGVVEASRAHHYPLRCRGAPEQCACPWDRLGDCPHGCAVDGVEIEAPAASALTQLCAPSSVEPEASPLTTVVSACDAQYTCVSSTVIRCGPPAVPLARCTRGCAREGQSIDESGGANIVESGVVALLCAREAVVRNATQ